jgi:signal transduction histidine kinase
MLGLRRALLALVAVGVAFAAVDVALALASGHESQKLATAILSPLIGLSFIGTGAFAWWRRPLNRFGLLMTTVGFAWFVSGLSESNSSTLFTVGTYLGPLYVALVVHMMLAFPAGHLETVGQRAIVAAAYLDVLLVRLPYFLLGADLAHDADAPRLHNAFALVDRPDRADVFNYTAGFVGVVVLAATLVLLLRKRRAATPPQRRAQAPMLWTGLGVIGLLGLDVLLEVLGVPHGVAQAMGMAALVAFAILPLAFLAGLVRSRYSRAGAVGALIERLNAPTEETGTLRDALAEALGDRSLTLVYWRPSAGHFVTFDGRRVELPGPGSGRAVTEVLAPRSPIEGSGEGRLIGAIIHDASLQEDEAALVRAVAAGAALALDNERLEAELRARVEELQSSRTRLLEVSMFERRRLERDLHDGAQQRLVALSLQLGLARRRLQDGDPDSGGRLLDAARDELGRALEELRELARGIHPAILTDRGLGAALEALAERAPLPVDLTEMPTERLPAPVEAAAYFVVAEALTNVVRYADARHASVRVARDDGYAVVEVSDDGVGGADPATGTGLRGLADRVCALDGRLEVESPPGRGTTVRAQIPCA